MVNQITKEEIDKIMEVEGKVRGAVFQTDAEYVRLKKGEEGLKEVEKKTKEFGQSIDYDQVKTMDWYPAGLRALSLLAIKETFGWDDKEIYDMGDSAPKYSFIVKMFLRHFLSPRRSFKESPNYWSKHWYMAGKLEFVELDEKKKYYILRLKNFKIHPILCVYLTGYFHRFTQYVIKSEKITIEETKCMFKGAPYHEFIAKWE